MSSGTLCSRCSRSRGPASWCIRGMGVWWWSARVSTFLTLRARVASFGLIWSSSRVPHRLFRLAPQTRLCELILRLRTCRRLQCRDSRMRHVRWTWPKHRPRLYSGPCQRCAGLSTKRRRRCGPRSKLSNRSTRISSPHRTSLLRCSFRSWMTRSGNLEGLATSPRGAG
ncbi:hypothetical protein D3C87_1482940 [compost metagenome]